MSVLFALLGVLAGAFVNYLAAVLPTSGQKKSVACAYCGCRRPVVSLVALMVRGGKCPTCGARPPLRYLLVEIGLGAAFVVLWLLLGLSLRLPLYLVYFTILALVTVTDLEHRLILNVVIYPSILLAALCSLITPGLGWGRALLGGAICFGFYFAMWLLGRVLFRAEALGFGDVKLALFVGLITGFPLVVQALLITAVVGFVIGGVLLLSRRRSVRDAVPYGPFLVAGTVVALVVGSLQT